MDRYDFKEHYEDTIVDTDAVNYYMDINGLEKIYLTDVNPKYPDDIITREFHGQYDEDGELIQGYYTYEIK